MTGQLDSLDYWKGYERGLSGKPVSQRPGTDYQAGYFDGVRAAERIDAGAAHTWTLCRIDEAGAANTGDPDAVIAEVRAILSGHTVGPHGTFNGDGTDKPDQPETEYTVLGYWADDDTRIVTGIVQGSVQVSGGEDVSEGGPFAERVWAVSAGAAEDMVNGTSTDVDF